MQAQLRWKAWILAVLLALGACATATKTPYYETAPSNLLKEDQLRYMEALEAQKTGKNQLAVELWQKFTKEHPRSYEAHNNLGMSYYANDQLSSALAELYKAHDLEPGDAKIKENLIRTLKFQTTLLTEGKEYERAIENWGVIAELDPEEKEKVSYKVEELEDKIFEQVKRANTMDDYKTFLEHYPESSNAPEARKRMEDLGKVPIVEAPVPAPVTTPPADAKKGVKTSEATKPAAEASAKSEKAVKVKVSAKSLRVRATPAADGKTIARIKAGTTLKVLGEKGEWYKIQYAKGKHGWISKKFVKPAK